MTTVYLGFMLQPATGWANEMMQTPSLKPNFYCVTLRLSNVRTHQMYSMITAFCLTIIRGCKVTTSRCVHGPDYWDATWHYLEL